MPLMSFGLANYTGSLILMILAPLLVGAVVYRALKARPGATSLAEYLLRALAILALALSIAEPFSERVSESSTATVLLDISDSMDESVADKLLSQAYEFRSTNQKIQILPFSKEASLFPLAPDDDSSFRSLKSSWNKLNVGSTNLEQPLLQQINSKSGNIILISDGYETEGNSTQIEQLLSSRGSRVYPLVPQQGAGVAQFKISHLHAPLVAPAEKSVDIRVSLVNSSASTQRGILEIKHDKKSVFKQEVSVGSGKEALFVAQSDPSKEGIKEVTATLTPIDTGYNSSSETVFVSGASREKVLLISGTQEDEELLKEAFQSQAYRLQTITEPSRGSALPDLAQFSSVLLNNVSALQLSTAGLRAVEQYAKAGGGVAMIGGNRSFGLGGYIDSPIEQALPVRLVPPQTVKKRLNVAVSLVLDKSRSMDQDNKLEYAKDAARAVVNNLKEDDFIQVIGFDAAPFIVVKMSQVGPNRDQVLDRIGRLIPAGRTNLLPSMDEARRSLMSTEAGRKHVIILTDGRIPSGTAYYLELADRMKSEGITVSTVMLGDDSDTAVLEGIASEGGGAFYQTTDASSLASVFIKDIKVSTGERTLKEDKEYLVRRGPDPLQTTTITAFPPLMGYVSTRPREGADLELVVYQADKAEPLLATWKYGAGKVKAFTSDANGRWSNSWARWAKFQSFWSEFLDDLRPKQGEAKQDLRFDLRYMVERGALKLDLTLFSEPRGTVTANLKRPDGSLIPVEFSPTARGRYQATLSEISAGNYELDTKVGAIALTPVAFQLSGELFGEKKGQGFNLKDLQRLASLSSGKINPSAVELASAPSLEISRTDLTPYALILAMLLLALEILRREVWRSGLRLIKRRRIVRTSRFD